MKLLPLTAILVGFVLPVHAKSPLIELPPHAQIRNVQFDALLRPQNASGAVGAPIILHPEAPWKCMTWTVTGKGNEVMLANVFTGKPFAASAESGEHQIFQARPGTRTALKFEPLDGGAWKITDVASGLALSAPDADHVTLAPWKNAKSQQWRVEAKELSDLTM